MEARRSSTFGLFDRRLSSASSYSWGGLRRSSSTVSSPTGSVGSKGVFGYGRRNSAAAKDSPKGSKRSRTDRWRILARKVLGNVSEQEERTTQSGTDNDITIYINKFRVRGGSEERRG